MPDWRKPEDYDFTKKLRPHRWAWEFLRRNPDYQQEWQEALRLFNAYCAEYGEDEGRRRFCYSERGDPADTRFCIGNFSMAQETTIPRWGIGNYHNPDHDVPFRLAFEGGHSLPPTFAPWLRLEQPAPDPCNLPIELRPWHVAVLFDARYPIEYQLESVRKSFPLHQEMFKERGGKLAPRPMRRAAGTWPLYLRVLDGRAAGATFRELAKVLLPKLAANVDPHTRISTLLRQARRMTKPESYRQIF